jgi:hypothetical protein
MRQRCQNPKATGYENYGGRGITVCPEWDVSYETFKAWAMKSGYADNLSIERIEANERYEPDNCTWADANTQSANQRKQPGRASKYIGVAPNGPSWQAYVNHMGKKHYIGTFELQWDAAKARDKFIIDHELPHKLNF